MDVALEQRAGNIPPRPHSSKRRMATLASASSRLRTSSSPSTASVAVGVDRIVAEAGVAKTTLYRHFRSKDALAVAVLPTPRAALDAEAGSSPRRCVVRRLPAGVILAIFDALDEWFGQADYEGCLFINTLLETRDQLEPGTPGSHRRDRERVRRRAAATRRHAGIRRFRRCGASDPDPDARQYRRRRGGSGRRRQAGRVAAHGCSRL